MRKSIMFGLDNYLTLPSVRYCLSSDSYIACRTEHEKACTEVLQSAVSVYRNVIVGGLAGYYPTQNDKSLLSVLGRVIYMMRHKHAELTEEQFGTCALLAADYESLYQTLNNLKEVPAFLLTKQASASTKKLYTKTIKRLHKFMRENVLGMFEKHAVCTKEVWDSVPQNIKRKWYVMKAEMSEGYLLNTVRRHEQLFTYEFLQLVSTKLMTHDTIVKILSHYEDFITSEERAVKKKEGSDTASLSSVDLVANAVSEFLDSLNTPLIPYSVRSDKLGSIFVEIQEEKSKLPPDTLPRLRAYADELSEKHDLVIFLSSQ